jgi:hypothetical protein
MNTTELRIGNLVNLMLNHEDFKTIRVDVTDLINISHGGVYEPIPLTEEFLLKFGFEYINRHDNNFITFQDWTHNYFLQCDAKKRDNKYLILDNCLNDLRSFSMVDIEYVHQLQNLYFALTGEELKLNNETSNI